jgi:hypothetical protein
VCPVGLDPARTYDVTPIRVGRDQWGRARHQPSWLQHGLQMTGQQLSSVGFSLPVLQPETSILLRLAATDLPPAADDIR